MSLARYTIHRPIPTEAAVATAAGVRRIHAVSRDGRRTGMVPGEFAAARIDDRCRKEIMDMECAA